MTTAETTEERLVRYLCESTKWLKQVTPSSNHSWGIPEGSPSHVSLSGRPDFGTILDTRTQDMPPFGSYVEDLLRDPAFTSLLATASGHGLLRHLISADFVAKNMLMTYLLNVQTLEFQPAVSSGIATTFSECVRTKLGGVRKIIVLNSFQSNLEAITLPQKPITTANLDAATGFLSWA